MTNGSSQSGHLSKNYFNKSILFASTLLLLMKATLKGNVS
jgi:hypothetical protein